jgi:metal-responsive CopG/Arc/MetJ family transcriptional regulator
MRTLVDIPDDDLSLLNKLSEAGNISRAELVRQAISAYLKTHKEAEREEGFGLWAENSVDGLAYQKKIRREWKG